MDVAVQRSPVAYLRNLYKSLLSNMDLGMETQGPATRAHSA